MTAYQRVHDHLRWIGGVAGWVIVWALVRVFIGRPADALGFIAWFIPLFAATMLGYFFRATR